MMRNWIKLVEGARNPTLVLPSWAVSDEILDQIDGLLLDMYKHDDAEARPSISRVMEEVQRMRHYINHGIWAVRNDGTFEHGD